MGTDSVQFSCTFYYYYYYVLENMFARSLQKTVVNYTIEE